MKKYRIAHSVLLDVELSVSEFHKQDIQYTLIRAIQRRENAQSPYCKRLRSPGIDSEESISPAYLSWRAGTTNGVVLLSRHAKN
jgi:hypothetical protein